MTINSLSSSLSVQKYPSLELPRAVETSNVGLVQKLLENHADPNAYCSVLPDDSSTGVSTPFIMAFKELHRIEQLKKSNHEKQVLKKSARKIITMLMRAGGNTNQRYQDSSKTIATPFFDVVRMGNPKLVALFLKASIPPKIDEHVDQWIKPKQHSVKRLGWINPLVQALGDENEKVVKLLLMSKANPNEVWESEHEMLHPIMRPIYDKNVNLATLLLNYRANPNGKNISWQINGIQVAVINRDKPMTKILLKYGSKEEEFAGSEKEFIDEVREEIRQERNDFLAIVEEGNSYPRVVWEVIADYTL